ncbi:MAG: sulfatase-like hydrolase/transferase [Fidelibacterota bacterium]|jgi:membrane-anchored protein YejM (alkaline phosphatase superfamily)|tara:strand:+ start:2356 stop:4311 length:1956 start_codon:yes stop_codon:yes gene_type:complete
MTRLTLFYFTNWLILLVYIFNNALFLNLEKSLSNPFEMEPFFFFMTLNTPFFLILIIKGATKGFAKIFRSNEFNFRYLTVFLILFTFIFTVIDAKVLSIYRDHFNLKLYGLLFEAGVMQDMGVHLSDLILLTFQLLITILWIIFSLKVSIWFYSKYLALIPNFITNNFYQIFKILVILSLIEKVFFSYFYYTEREDTLTNWNSIPSYTVLRMSKVWKPILNAPSKAEKAAAKITWDFESDFLDSQNKLSERIKEITADKNDVNIVFLVFESLRYDMNVPEIMPNLNYYKSKDKWISSKQHFSNSNCTGNGIFGTLSGQTPFYWYPSYKKELQPSPLSIFDKLGYEIDVYTTTALGYSDMDKHIFTNAIDNVYKFTGYGGGLGHPMVKRSDLFKWDQIMVDEFLEKFTNKTSNAPNLSYLWFYSTHYNYYFPEEFGKFKPYIDRHYQIYEKGLREESDLVFNRYKNSAYFVDSQIRKIVDRIETNGQMENTIIVILGDHGEEFNEFGRFAHSYSLKNVQTSTPFIMYMPEVNNINYNITSHADIMPTIMDYIDISIPYQEIVSGKSLLDYNPNLDYAIIQECEITERPKKFLIADKDWKMEFSLSGGKIESGLLETINDETVFPDTASLFKSIKQTLLKKAEKNLGHYSIQN